MSSDTAWIFNTVILKPIKLCQCHTSLQKGQEEGPKKLQVSQIHLLDWKGGGTTHSGGHL